jgi:outer membrane receptor protein involved in Fe transport
MEKGRVSGWEFAWQHLFQGSPYGMTFNYTLVSGGNVEPDIADVSRQFILPGLGDSGNASVFYEDDRHTLRLALNYRAETAAGFANYDQPVFVEERKQVDFSYQYRYNENTTVFFDAANILDEETRLFVRHPEMLFLAQDHGPVYKLGLRTNF